MAPRFRFVVWTMMATVGAVLTLEATPLRAQTLNEGWKAGLEPLYTKHIRTIGDLRTGKIKLEADNKNQLEAIDVLARYHTYGPYLRNLETQPGELDKAYQLFVKDVEGIQKAKDRETIQPFVDVFRDRVRARALDVIQFESARPIHKIHNARLLAKVAELGQGALADTLLTVLKDDKQNDGVRYYVFRGLSTLLAQTPTVVTKEQGAKCAEALVDFLEKRKGPDKKAAQEEIDGFCMLRREAVRALAQLHTPSYSEKNRPALVLARIAGNDERLSPAPRIDERIEAAIGLARMQPTSDKQYHADYAAAQIAKCVGDFAQMYNKERAPEMKDQKARPYRVDAALLREALAVLKTVSGKDAFVTEVLNHGNSVLQEIDRGKETTAGDTTWLSSQSDPPSKELFQGAEDSTVKSAAAG